MVLSIFAAAIVLLPIALASLLFLQNIFKSKWSSDSYPPVAATIVGHILNFKRIHDFYADHHYRYKTYRLAYPTHSYVYTTDPANVEYILRTNFTNYGRGLLLKSTMDSICKVGFGIEMNSLSKSNSGSEASFARAFDTANGMVLWRYLDITWKFKRYFNIGSEAILRESIETVDDFIYKIIQSRRQEISAQNGNEKPDLLSRFIRLSEEGPEKLSDKYLRDIMLNFIIAGRDTTAVTLAWFIFLLCKNPGAEEKILQEIHDVVEENECGSLAESISMFAQGLTHRVLDKMHYLHASLSETLRLYPAVPVDAKHVDSDDTLPDGYGMKKGDLVNYVPYSMGRMEYLWGIDAKEFKPERWLENGVFQSQSPFKFTAFQAGPRICLGKEFAYLQMKIVAAVLLRFFKFEAVEGKEVTYQPSLTLHMNEDGLNVHIKCRSDNK
ncbi:cytochrome P450 704C1 isoform X2 [Cryptomeria japonica]|uniref:cytochrome P450 704C1 isoform X2 n=1 Tax=Cryptomeria japonica TaxID=3369 RepID=UPI0027DA4749|nr:cytochrome P450 704C1 isoform X2 [Cryptomeria japonica]